MTMSNKDVANLVAEQLRSLSMYPQALRNGRVPGNRPTDGMARETFQATERNHQHRCPNLSLIADLINDQITKYIKDVTGKTGEYLAALWIRHNTIIGGLDGTSREPCWSSDDQENVAVCEVLNQDNGEYYYHVRCSVILDLRDRQATQAWTGDKKRKL